MSSSDGNVVFRRKCCLPLKKKNNKKWDWRPNTAVSQDGGVGDPIPSSALNKTIYYKFM
jgi:hypothetical protein